MKYKFSAEQYAEIKAAQKANQDKQIENRLNVLALRCEGKSLKEIASATGFHYAHISNLIRKYFEEGVSAISEKHYWGVPIRIWGCRAIDRRTLLPNHAIL